MFQFLKGLLRFSKKDLPAANEDTPIKGLDFMDRLSRACMRETINHERSVSAPHRCPPSEAVALIANTVEAP